MSLSRNLGFVVVLGLFCRDKPFMFRSAITMRRYSPPYHSPPRRGYGGRGRSPPPRRGYGGRKEQGSCSLLVRNIPISVRAEDLRVPFERFGPVRDVYIPKDYYSGEPRGFAFVEFVDPYDASEAQYHMNRQSHENGQKKCAVELESGVILVMKGVVLLIMGGPVHVPALLVTADGPGQGHTLLHQDAEMTILLPREERNRIGHLLPGVSQKSLMKIKSGDPILQPVEMMLMRRGHPHLTAMDPSTPGVAQAVFRVSSRIPLQVCR
ncbi:hypothetical protein EJB05_48032, partial [Eragrostis curvula]